MVHLPLHSLSPSLPLSFSHARFHERRHRHIRNLCTKDSGTLVRTRTRQIALGGETERETRVISLHLRLCVRTNIHIHILQVCVYVSLSVHAFVLLSITRCNDKATVQSLEDCRRAFFFDSRSLYFVVGGGNNYSCKTPRKEFLAYVSRCRDTGGGAFAKPIR